MSANEEMAGVPMADCDRDNAIGMALARRTYLYTLFHVVFGSHPTAESIPLVFGADTADAFAYLLSQLALPEFAHVTSRCLGSAGRTLAECADDACTCVEGLQAKAADAEGAAFMAERLGSDYDKMFQVPGERYVHPWESPYTGKESMVFQESTLDVRRFYHEAGFKLQAEKHFPDDHIAAMMDYMSNMAQRAYDAFADGDDEEARRILATQAHFAENHILNWVDNFADKVGENDPHDTYSALAAGMAAFAFFDSESAEAISCELAG